MNKDVDLIQVTPSVYYLDSRRVEPLGVSGVYLVVADGITLIETATTLTAPYILEAVRDLGYAETDVRRAIVTHIHLDHAGATGWLVARLPQLQVYVHERGAAHLVDPSKLIRSAETVYGDRSAVLALHGEILPVPSDNVVPVTNTELDVGGAPPLRILSTPGHASHHLCIFEPESGCLFSGEALGHCYPESDMLIPAVAPPSFDLAACRETAGKLREMKPRTICFSQFGPHRDPEFVIEESTRLLEEYDGFIKTRMRRGPGTDEIIKELARWLALGEDHEKELSLASLRSLVLGFQAHFRRTGEVA